MKKKKRLGSVFRQLVISYILFSVLTVVGLSVFIFTILLGNLASGNFQGMAPYDLVDKEGNVKNISVFVKNGGWLEKLDKDYHIIDVYGKKLDTPVKYTQKEIYEYLTMDNVVDTSKNTYRGFIKEVQVNDETYYFLSKINRDYFKVTYNLELGKGPSGDKISFLITTVFFLFFGANCFFMSRYLLRKIKYPLAEITGGMEQVIHYGVEGVQLKFQAQKEFEEIRDSFNIMTERLENEKREKRVSEEKKNRMLLELSHDIKTPIATIKSYANALQEGLVEEDRLKECYQIIDRKAERVDVLAEEMFLMLKLDNPDYRLEMERVDIAELMRSICSGYYNELEDIGIGMHVQIPEGPVWHNTDEREFSRIIINLLDNIVKYNQTGQAAWVILSELQTGQLEIQIQDDGEAVAPEIQSLLFDPFVRGDKARGSKGGTGLGLAIAKKLIEKLDGNISYEYKNEKNIFVLQLGKTPTFSDGL